MDYVYYVISMYNKKKLIIQYLKLQHMIINLVNSSSELHGDAYIILYQLWCSESRCTRYTVINSHSKNSLREKEIKYGLIVA